MLHECVLSHLNIRNWFTRSHPSNGGDRSEIARMNGLIKTTKIEQYFENEPAPEKIVE